MDSVKLDEHVPDDLSFLSLALDEILTVVDYGINGDDDEGLALTLQFQEVLVSSVTNSVSKKSIQDVTETSVSLTIYCQICKEMISSTDIIPSNSCSHAMCSMCLYIYVNKMIQQNDQSKVSCSHSGCTSVLDPETFREFVPPRLFDKWITAHSYDSPKKGVIRLSKQVVNSENQAKDSTSQVDPNTLLKLTEIATKCKENRPVEFPGSVKEVGESSSSSADNQIAPLEFYCAICMETKNFSENFTVGDCFHLFCIECVRSYIAAKVHENVLIIKCPDVDCKEGVLDPETCRKILPKSVFDRWGLALCESALGTKKFYCPFKECSGLLIDENGESEGSITNAECPHCHRMFCAQCEVPWHDGIDCRGFQRLDKDERGREDIMLRNLASESKWQRCPQCKMFVEKIDGCMFMQCRCGYCFCYVCATEMSKEYHFCTKCQR